MVAALDLGRGRVEDPAEELVAAQPDRQRGEVVGARVVARLVEPDRVRVRGVVEPQLRAARFIWATNAGTEPADASASVSAASLPEHQQAVEQVADLDPLARLAGRAATRPASASYAGRDDLVEQQLAPGHVGGHQLRRRRDRKRALGPVRGEHLAVGGVDEDPGARRQAAGGVGRRRAAARRREEREQDEGDREGRRQRR